MVLWGTVGEFSENVGVSISFLLDLREFLRPELCKTCEQMKEGPIHQASQASDDIISLALES